MGTADTLSTRLTERLGIAVPVTQAPVGSASCPALAAAVSNAGGLGMLAISWASPAAIRDAIRETKTLTSRPFGVNLVLELPQEERLAVALAEGVRLVSFFWGDPAPYVTSVHAAGGLVFHSAGDVAEAKAGVEAGADVVVAQGWEAGGHVRGEVATTTLVRAVVDAVSPTPVVAAGGISDGRGLVVALALGAEAAWIGTRFLASREARVHPVYQARLLATTETSTMMSSLFDGGWPDAPHRTLRNTTVRRWEAEGRPAAPGRPGEGDAIGADPDGRPIMRYSSKLPAFGATGETKRWRSTPVSQWASCARCSPQEKSSTAWSATPIRCCVGS